MADRGFTRKLVEEAIKRGSKEFQSPNKILYNYRYFVVVTRKKEDNDLIITVKPRW